MTYLQCILNNSTTISNIVNAEINSNGDKQADSCKIIIAGKLSDIDIGNTIQVVVDKVPLNDTRVLCSFERYTVNEINSDSSISYDTIPVYTNGYAGHGIQLKNDSNRITISNLEIDDNNFDVIFWCKFNAVNRDQIIFHIGSDLRLGINTSGRLYGIIDGTTYTTDLNCNNNTWYCLRIKQQGSSVIIYRNTSEYSISDYATITGNNITAHIGGFSGKYFAGVIDVLRIKNDSVYTDEQYTKIVNNVELAAFTKFGGIIQSYDYTTNGHTEITCISHGSILNRRYATYNTHNDIDIIDLLSDTITNNTNLNVITEDKSNITLNAPRTEGKVIDIIRQYIDTTDITFYVDPFRNLVFFRKANRVTPGVLSHGENCRVEVVENNDKFTYSDAFIQGNDSKPNDNTPLEDTTEYTNERERSITDLYTGSADTNNSNMPNGGELERIAKAGINLGNTINSIELVRLTMSPLKGTDTGIVYVGKFFDGYKWVQGDDGSIYAERGWAVNGYRRLAELYGATDGGIGDSVTTTVTIPDTEYTFSGSIFTINNNYTWPTRNNAQIVHDSIHNYTYSSRQGSLPLGQLRRKPTSNNRRVTTFLDSNQFDGKYNIIEIHYTYNNISDYVVSHVNPALLVIPHVHANINNIITSKTKKINVEYIKNNTDKYNYLQSFLQNNNTPLPNIVCRTYMTNNYVYRPGDLVHVKAKYADIDNDYLIKSIKLEYPKGIVTIELDQYRPDFVQDVQIIERGLNESVSRNSDYSENYRGVQIDILKMNLEITNNLEQDITVTPPPTRNPPDILLFANPINITLGDTVTLSWTNTGGSPTSLSINQGVGNVLGRSSVTITPASTGDILYTITARNSDGTDTSSITISVLPVGSNLPVISSFSASPTNITQGDTTTLSWSVSNANTLSIDQGVGTVTGTSVVVTPSGTGTITYTLTATNSTGSVTANTSVVVAAPTVQNPTVTFTAASNSITSGQSTTLSWTTTNATSVSINNNVGSQSNVQSGSVTVSPTVTTTYTITASGGAGTTPATASVTITVTAPSRYNYSFDSTINMPSAVTGNMGGITYARIGTNDRLVIADNGTTATNDGVQIIQLDGTNVSRFDPVAQNQSLSGIAALVDSGTLYFYVLDSTFRQVYCYESDGTYNVDRSFNVSTGDTTKRSAARMTGMCEYDGKLWVLDRGNNIIESFNPGNSTVQDTISLQSHSGVAFGITVDTRYNVFCIVYARDTIHMYSTSGAYEGTFSVNSEGYRGIAYHDNALYLVYNDRANKTIRKYTRPAA